MPNEPKRLRDDDTEPEDVRAALAALEAEPLPRYDVHEAWTRFATKTSGGRTPPPPLEAPATPPRTVGRYTLYGKLGSGGMGTVHYARLAGAAGFTRTVAVKVLHPHLSSNRMFANMFIDEARLASRVRHPNVVQILDVVAEREELQLVMEYVEGESLDSLLDTLRARGEAVPMRIAASIVAGALHGLHAAHEAKDEAGESLHVVHRDVSPQNVLVGADGVARVLDFGVAKAIGRLHTTTDGALRGKVAYMAPEQLEQQAVTRQSDVYAASVVLWEALTSRQLFAADNGPRTMARVLKGGAPAPSTFAPGSPDMDAIVLRGLSKNPADRYATAKDMALALERDVGVAPAFEVGAWVERVAHEQLRARRALVAEIERDAPRAQKSRPRLAWAFVAAAAIGLALIAAVAVRRARPAASPAQPLVLSTSALPSPPPPPQAQSADTGLTAPAAAPVVSRAPRPTRVKPVVRPSASCNPPWTVDEQGHRHYIPSCFPD